MGDNSEGMSGGDLLKKPTVTQQKGLSDNWRKEEREKVASYSIDEIKGTGVINDGLPVEGQVESSLFDGEIDGQIVSRLASNLSQSSLIMICNGINNIYVILGLLPWFPS